MKVSQLTPAFLKIEAGIIQSVLRLATGWMIRRSNPGGSEISRIRSDRSSGTHSLLYNWHSVFFQEVKRPGRGVGHPPLSSAEVKERVELYFYSRSGTAWPVLGSTLPLSFFKNRHNRCSLVEDVRLVVNTKHTPRKHVNECNDRTVRLVCLPRYESPNNFRQLPATTNQ